jgi:hypothetical protein
MFFLLTVGTLVAVSQQRFYSYANGNMKRVCDIPGSGDPCWHCIRLFFQTVLVAAVGSVFTQRFWFAVRRESLEASSIVAMFNVLGDPRQFFNTEFVFKTKLLLVFALISYLLPVATSLSPGALTGIHNSIHADCSGK